MKTGTVMKIPVQARKQKRVFYSTSFSVDPTGAGVIQFVRSCF